MQTFPGRDGAGVVLDGDIVMKPGTYGIELYCSLKTLEAGYAPKVNPINVGICQKLFRTPWQLTRNFRVGSNWTNRNCAVVTAKCEGSEQYVYGGQCTPLQLNPESLATSEENKTTFTFEAIVKGQKVPGIYQGTLTLETANVIAADDATPSVAAGGGEYECTDNTAANEITSLDDAVHGTVYALVGLGGSNPSTVTKTADFLLKDGATWTATAGAKLTVRAFTDDAASFKFVEVSRS